MEGDHPVDRRQVSRLQDALTQLETREDTMVEFTKLTGHVGVEVTGIDLNAPLDA